VLTALLLPRFKSAPRERRDAALPKQSESRMLAIHNYQSVQSGIPNPAHLHAHKRPDRFMDGIMRTWQARQCVRARSTDLEWHDPSNLADGSVFASHFRSRLTTAPVIRILTIRLIRVPAKDSFKRSTMLTLDLVRFRPQWEVRRNGAFHVTRKIGPYSIPRTY